MFREANWYQVLGGLGFIDQKKLTDHQNKNRQEYNSNIELSLNRDLKNLNSALRISHRDYLKTLTNAYLRDQNG